MIKLHTDIYLPFLRLYCLLYAVGISACLLVIFAKTFIFGRKRKHTDKDVQGNTSTLQE